MHKNFYGYQKGNVETRTIRNNKMELAKICKR